MKKITVVVRTNKVGSEVSLSFDIDDEDWDDLTDEDKNELCLESIFDLIEWDYHERTT